MSKSSRGGNGEFSKHIKGKKSYSNKKANKHTSNVKRQSKESEFLNESENFQSIVTYDEHDQLNTNEKEEEEEENSTSESNEEENAELTDHMKKLPFDLGNLLKYACFYRSIAEHRKNIVFIIKSIS
jgi:ATP-dependent 26S proteasome regulatory subunit